MKEILVHLKPNNFPRYIDQLTELEGKINEIDATKFNHSVKRSVEVNENENEEEGEEEVNENEKEEEKEKEEKEEEEVNENEGNTQNPEIEQATPQKEEENPQEPQEPQ